MTRFGKIDQQETGSHSDAEFEDILRSQEYQCWICGNAISLSGNDRASKAVPDHIYPASLGGVDFWWNIAAACQRCNELRGNKLPGPFLMERKVFQQPVRITKEIYTTIPFIKKRGSDGKIFVESHLETSPYAKSAIANIGKHVIPERDGNYFNKRRQLLREQSQQVMQRFA